MPPMTIDLPTLRLIAAVIAVPVLAIALYKRIGRIATFQKSELARGARFARDALGALVIAVAVTLALQELRADWRASRRGRCDP